MSAIGCQSSADRLTPDYWPAGDLEKFAQLARDPQNTAGPAEAKTMMVAGIAEPVAIRAGFEALNDGGTAADAVITTALADVVLSAASIITFSGEMTLTYFDAGAGQVSTLDATFGTVKGEGDPLTIPGQDSPSGRSAMVPGFMAGVQAIHDRFGKLPFAELFGPAIYFADRGFVLDQRLAGRIKSREAIITRLAEGKAIFTKPSGELYQAGDEFRQPAAAQTLRQISRYGADYIYRGVWGRRFVAAVKRGGGHMDLQDLAEYRPIWTRPAQTLHRGYQVFGPGLPGYGGLNTVEALNLAEAADLPARGDYTSSPEALSWLIDIANVADLLSPPLIGNYVPPDVIRRYVPDSLLAPEARVRADNARAIWALMQKPEWRRFARDAGRARADSGLTESILRSWGRRRAPQHTSGIIAVDRWGNVAVLMHSVNASLFGSGIFVDGFSVPDPGAYLQALIAAVGPGKRVPLWDNTTIAIKDGKAAIASVSTGAAYFEVNVANLIGMMDYGLEPQAAGERPQLRKQWPYGEPLRLLVGPGGFEEGVLTAVQRGGQNITIVKDPAQAGSGGAWVGVRIDPGQGIRAGFANARSALALGK